MYKLIIYIALTLPFSLYGLDNKQVNKIDNKDSLKCKNLILQGKDKSNKYCISSAKKFKEIKNYADASWYYLLGKDLNATVVNAHEAIKREQFSAYSYLAFAQYLLYDEKNSIKSHTYFLLSIKNAEKYFFEDLKYIKLLYGKKIFNGMVIQWKYSVLSVNEMNLNIYEEFAEKNNLRAQQKLASYFFKKKNFIKSKRYYEKLQQKGNKESYQMLQFIALETKNSNDNQLMYEYAKYLESKYNKNSIDWYEKSAQLGNINAQNYLAQDYWEKAYAYYKIYKDSNGENVHKRALYWNLYLAKKGDIDSQARLIDIYSSSLYGVENLETAKEWGRIFVKNNKDNDLNIYLEDIMLKAAGKGIVESPGLLYKFAKELYAKSPQKAIIIYEKAAKLKNRNAQKRLAEIYEDREEYKKSIRWYKQLLENATAENIDILRKKINELLVLSGNIKNDDFLIQYANKYYSDGQYSKSLKFYNMLENQSLYVIYRIGMIYKYQEKYNLAIKIFNSLAKQNHIDACRELSEFYYDDKYGLKNKKSYKYWSKKVSELLLKYKSYKKNVVDAIHIKDIELVDKLIVGNAEVDFEFACEAVKDGNLEVLKLLDKKNMYLDWTQKCPVYLYGKKKKYNLLYYASLFGYDKITQHLLDKKVFLNTRQNQKALQVSLIHGNADISQQLINAGISGNYKPWIYNAHDENYKIAKQLDKLSLTSAFNTSSYKLFKNIVKTKRNKEFRYKDEKLGLPLFSYKYIELLVQEGFTINHKEKLFKIAAYNNDLQLMQIMLKEGVNVDKYRSAFHSAVYHQEYGIVKSILEHSKNPLVLIQSVYSKYSDVDNVKIIKLFLKYGLSPNSPYVLSSASNNFKALRLLIDNGAKIQKKGSILFYIVKQNKSYDEIIKELDYLIEHGASVNIVTMAGDTLVSKILQRPNQKNRKLVKYLMKKGLNINSKGWNNMSVLQEKILSRDIKNVEFLLSIGAIPSMEDFRMVMENNQIEIFNLLLRYNTEIPLKLLVQEANNYDLPEISMIIQTIENTK
jgi:hypothetical protein